MRNFYTCCITASANYRLYSYEKVSLCLCSNDGTVEVSMRYGTILLACCPLVVIMFGRYTLTAMLLRCYALVVMLVGYCALTVMLFNCCTLIVMR